MAITGQTTSCTQNTTINSVTTCTAATQATNLSCTTTDPTKTGSCGSIPTNNVSGTGAAGQDSNGGVVRCPPTFNSPLGVQNPASSAGTQSSYTNEATSYTISGAGGSNPTCVAQAPTSATSTCPIVACTTTGGGGGTCFQCGNPDVQCPRNCGGSPIIFDLSGNGFSLTDAAHGVLFDISDTGVPIQIGWTAKGAANAFLCLPDSNGMCDDGKDLFGNWTPQPPSNNPNGFAALAVYDQPTNGGNGDGVIDARDAIFSSLRLWIDANHDGISQPNELYTLPALGVTSISLNYKWDQRTDQYGNVFRYRAQVNPGDPASVGRVAYDVYFVTAASTASGRATSCPVPTRSVPTWSLVGSSFTKR